MIEYPISSVLSILNSFSVKKLEQVIQRNEWKKLFIDSGDALIKYMEKEGAFVEDLRLVFSKEKMAELARKTEKEPGTSFTVLLHDELASLLRKYEVDENQIEACVCHFSNEIIRFIEMNDPGKATGVFLQKWKDELLLWQNRVENKIDETNRLIRNLSDTTGSVYSLQAFESMLSKQSRYKMSLDFFELDDDDFHVSFEAAVNRNQTIVYVEGKSKEESLYRVLNEIKQHFPDKPTWIIKDEYGWKQFENAQGQILVPVFPFGNNYAVSGNVNIFVCNEEEFCNNPNKLILHRRTRSNLLQSLVNIGVSHEMAQKWLEQTHGIFSALKSKIFNCPSIQKIPKWTEENLDIVVAALLIGKWTDGEGDQEIFRILSGKSYSDCIKALRKYERNEQPLIIRIENHHGLIYQIACVEEAWITILPSIDKEIKTRFFETFGSVMGQHDPVYEDLSEQLAAIRAGKGTPKYSSALKKGMLRTLILFSCLDEDKQDQHLASHSVKQVLDGISSKDDWLSISPYITDLCEAAPDIVLERLEKELKQGTGMLDLFSGSEYYYHILWAVEQLIQQEEYLFRAIEWLWEVDNLNFEYRINNTPRSILEIVFCAWINLTPLTCDQKIREATKAMVSYPNAWDIICSRLPKTNDTVFSTLCKTQFRELFEESPVVQNDTYRVFIAYLDLCIEYAGQDIAKWSKLLKELTHYAKDIQEERINLLVKTVLLLDDPGKTAIVEELRSIVYHHRRYTNSTWAMREDQINLFENAADSINVTDKTYEYLYLFRPIHDFPLLHPVPYSPEDNASGGFDLEEKQVDKEITSKVEEFTKNQMSLCHLIEIASVTPGRERLGYVLAHYFDKESYNEIAFECLVKSLSSKPYQIGRYVRVVAKDNLSVLRIILEKTKVLTDDPTLISEVISCQLVNKIEDCLIFRESVPIKKEFWGSTLQFTTTANPDPALLIKSLEECQEYGTMDVYMELLFIAKDSVSVEDTLYWFCQAEHVRIENPNSMFSWYVEQILDLLHIHFMDDRDKAFEISRMEWFFGHYIHWDQMKCLQQQIKTDPRVYAYLIEIMYKKDHVKTVDPEKQKRASSMFGVFHEIHFCPAEKDGVVDYNDLKQWVDNFSKILDEQDQSSLWDTVVGDLLPYSPADDDGYMPCKAVRQLIEEYHTPKLHSAYFTTELNKRGVFAASAGKAEKAISQRYKTNANMIRETSPWTARIYDDLSEHYEEMSIQERKSAEDGL